MYDFRCALHFLSLPSNLFRFLGFDVVQLVFPLLCGLVFPVRSLSGLSSFLPPSAHTSYKSSSATQQATTISIAPTTLRTYTISGRSRKGRP